MTAARRGNLTRIHSPRFLPVHFRANGMNLHALNICLHFRPSESQTFTPQTHTSNQSTFYQAIDAAHCKAKALRELAFIEQIIDAGIVVHLSPFRLSTRQNGQMHGKRFFAP